MYFANRPQFVQRNVTWLRGGGMTSPGSFSISPEHEGHESGVPLRSLAMRLSAWAGLYEAGRGLRIDISLRNPGRRRGGLARTLLF